MQAAHTAVRPQAAVYLLLNVPYLSGGGLRLRRPQRVLHLLGQVVGNGLALLQLGLHQGPLLLAGLPAGICPAVPEMSYLSLQSALQLLPRPAQQGAGPLRG